VHYKKILLGIFILIFGINIVNAENTLEFNETDGKLYYNTDVLDKETFMDHTDMTPGKEYEDILNIENNSQKTYKLYMKAIKREQSDLANELLDNITMKVYLDGELIYDGKASGLDYNNSGVNLQESIYIGEYELGKKQVIKVETMLDLTYENINNEVLSYIDWKFYASYGEEVIPINPNTGNFGIKKVLLICLSSLLLLIILITSYALNRKKKLS